MKKILVTIIILSVASGLTACTRQDYGMAAGGVLGGAAGSALTRGNPVGAVAGAVGGAYVGRQLAN